MAAAYNISREIDNVLLCGHEVETQKSESLFNRPALQLLLTCRCMPLSKMTMPFSIDTILFKATSTLWLHGAKPKGASVVSSLLRVPYLVYLAVGVKMVILCS